MDCVVSPMRSERRQVRPVPLDNPLKELARSKPSDVMSRYSTTVQAMQSLAIREIVTPRQSCPGIDPEHA
jgi:hypothetical protein